MLRENNTEQGVVCVIGAASAADVDLLCLRRKVRFKSSYSSYHRIHFIRNPSRKGQKVLYLLFVKLGCACRGWVTRVVV
jgi:hypothetical protein